MSMKDLHTFVVVINECTSTTSYEVEHENNYLELEPCDLKKVKNERKVFAMKIMRKMMSQHESNHCYNNLN